MTPFEPLYDADEMRAAEAGHDVGILMERAGRGVAEQTLARFPHARRFALVCGEGANGGDGRIAGRLLREAGREAHETEDPGGADVVVDALFGTGFRGEPRPEAAALIEAINTAGAPVVAVDIPSGVDASSGEVPGAAVQADLTVTFHGRKVGLEVAPGRFRCGDVVVADIGLAERQTTVRRVTADVLRTIPRKQPSDTKYTAGSVLVVGGAPGTTGAVCLAAEAAFRADAGYVSVAVPEAALPAVEARLLEPVKAGWADGAAAETVLAAAERAHAVAIGPGLGRSGEARALVRTVLRELDVPVVVDADALHELEPVERQAATVFTPHEGEAARLLGLDPSWVAAHRLHAARAIADGFGAVVVLKGADTIVASGGTAGAFVSGLGTPALATAGSGDVLTGILAALLAKVGEAEQPPVVAAAGVALQQTATRFVPARGAVASDLVAALPRVLW
jgi:ADP-dependent NAD(P)H-hydrate dehydratase / NAD(P)H-hydrate epimerase